MNFIEGYAAAIESGEIIAGKKIKSVYAHIVANMHDDTGRYVYDDGLALRAIDFIETFMRIPKLRGNPPFKLELWQKAYISCIFGFVDRVMGLRQYRETFLFVGRKNAKTLLSAAIAIYLMIADGENAPEIYCAATDRKQSKILWDMARQIIETSPALKKRLRCMSHVIKCPSNFGVFAPLSRNSGSLDGLAPSVFCLDELHALKDRNMYDVIVGGMYSRAQPLTMITSTGGYIVPDSIFDSKYDEYMRIIKGYEDGSYIDETTLPLLYELDDKADIENPAYWIKANPNLGVSKSIETLTHEVERAKLDEKTKRDLLVKQFNFRESSREAFFEFSDVKYDCHFDPAILSGLYYFGGVDLSQTTDLTAAVALVPCADALYILSQFWIPEDTVQEHIQRDRVSYDKWIQRDLVRVCKGSIINPKDVVEWFIEIQEQYNIYAYGIGYDAYNAQYLTADLENNFGANLCHKVQQNFKGLSSQMYESKAYFKQRKIFYNDNPVFLWNLLNTQAITDSQGNIKPYKNRAGNTRIDGYAAFLDAFCVYLDNKDNI